MVELKIYYGTVIDNDDTNSDDGEKLSRVKVMLLPEMKDMASSYLPWLRPFFVKGMSADSFSHLSPEIGDKVWCIFLDNFFKDGYYFSGAFIDGFFDIDTVENTISDNITEEEINITYPNLKFKQFADGTIEFHNTDTGDRGVYHSSGAYFIINSDGNIILKKGISKIQINNFGITIESTQQISLKTGDASNWKPCIIGNCLWSGAPHGGTLAGITKLKGE